MELDALKYGFIAGSRSELTITINGNVPPSTDQADLFCAFSFGDEQYLSFATDIDGGLAVNADLGAGIFIYPAHQLKAGDASILYDEMEGYSARNQLAGGDAANWALFKNEPYVNAARPDPFPLQFTFINDDNDNTLSVIFDGVTRVYNNSDVPTLKKFKLYMAMDPLSNEVMQISSFECVRYVFYTYIMIYFVSFILIYII